MLNNGGRSGDACSIIHLGNLVFLKAHVIHFDIESFSPGKKADTWLVNHLHSMQPLDFYFNVINLKMIWTSFLNRIWIGKLLSFGSSESQNQISWDAGHLWLDFFAIACKLSTKYWCLEPTLTSNYSSWLFIFFPLVYLCHITSFFFSLCSFHDLHSRLYCLGLIRVIPMTG